MTTVSGWVHINLGEVFITSEEWSTLSGQVKKFSPSTVLSGKEVGGSFHECKVVFPGKFENEQEFDDWVPEQSLLLWRISPGQIGNAVFRFRYDQPIEGNLWEAMITRPAKAKTI